MGFRRPKFKNPFADVSTGIKTDTELAELVFNRIISTRTGIKTS